MAERRMFSKIIIDTDIFLDMPISARLLYYDLSMRADDDGFVSSPKKIMKIIGASNDDLNVLIARQFVIPFDSGVLVIRHWRIHNSIRKDRYHPTVFTDEKALLNEDENGVYNDWQPNGNQMDTEVRLGKDSIGKDSIGNILPGAANADTGPTEPAIVNLILNDKSLYPITQSPIDHWAELYPAVDIKQELLKMQGWLESNPTKRKTKRGIERFITSWLSREQDRGGATKGYYTNTQKPAEEPEEKLGTYY